MFTLVFYIALILNTLFFLTLFISNYKRYFKFLKDMVSLVKRESDKIFSAIGGLLKASNSVFKKTFINAPAALLITLFYLLLIVVIIVGIPIYLWAKLGFISAAIICYVFVITVAVILTTVILGKRENIDKMLLNKGLIVVILSGLVALGVLVIHELGFDVSIENIIKKLIDVEIHTMIVVAISVFSLSITSIYVLFVLAYSHFVEDKPAALSTKVVIVIFLITSILGLLMVKNEAFKEGIIPHNDFYAWEAFGTVRAAIFSLLAPVFIYIVVKDKKE